MHNKLDTSSELIMTFIKWNNIFCTLTFSCHSNEIWWINTIKPLNVMMFLVIENVTGVSRAV